MMRSLLSTGRGRKDITKRNEAVLVGFRSAYVFDRLSRDLRPSLCAPDGCRGCHFRKSPR